jgi:hypothetical protein
MQFVCIFKSRTENARSAACSKVCSAVSHRADGTRILLLIEVCCKDVRFLCSAKYVAYYTRDSTLCVLSVQFVCILKSRTENTRSAACSMVCSAVSHRADGTLHIENACHCSRSFPAHQNCTSKTQVYSTSYEEAAG